jgi:hypothetical protein
MLLRVKNLLDQNAQTTFLTQLEASGTTTLHVKNANGYATNQWAVQLGKTGEEQSEIGVLSNAAPSGTTLTLGTATNFSHPTDTPVYAVKFNKIIWLRSITGTAGAATAFATTTITPDSEFTQYDDTTGASTYAYKSAYYNSLTTGTSTQSDWLLSVGYDFYSLSSIKQRVKDKLFNAGFIGDDSVLKDWINEYMEILTNKVIDVNQDYNLGSTNVAFAASGELGTITDVDFKQVRRAWYTENGNDVYTMTKMESTTPRPNQEFNETQPYFYMYDNNVMARWPHDNVGTAKVLYYRLSPVLVNETDTLPIPMRGYTKGFVDYALAQAYRKDSKNDIATIMENSAMSQAERFMKEMTPRTKSGPQMIDIVETVSEDNVDWYFRV